MPHLLAISLLSVLTLSSVKLSITNTATLQSWEPYFSEKFSCWEDQAGGNGFQCKGYMANGELQQSAAGNWYNVLGSAQVKTTRFSLCDKTLDGAIQNNVDLCCENDYFSDCGVCGGFSVWPFETFEEMSGDSRVTFDDNWKETYLGQKEDNTKAYDNTVFPAGFMHAKLREFNDPPVCVFIPSAGGRVIEVRVEPEESGNTVCFNDLYDDTEERNNPGQITTCDDTRLRTCFSDGDLKKNANDNTPGFPFYINCVEGCEDSDINLWFRARASETSWADVTNQDAEFNMEMWCMWMDQNDTKWDTYPSEIAPPGAVLENPPDDSVSAISVLFSAVFVLFFAL